MMVSQVFLEQDLKDADTSVAYGDMNLFCTCGPVDAVDGMTGAAAPAPT